MKNMRITFVDENDAVIGSGTKQEAWAKGTWHRIVRIFLVNAKGEILIQKRSEKLESLPGLWDHSAAGHIDEGETYDAAAKRELAEETGVTGVALKLIAHMKIQETDEKDKIKNRFNAVYVGRYDGDIRPDPEEVAETRWISPAELAAWMNAKPEDFTHIFQLVFKEFLKYKDTV